ncbi:hypothetical protein CBL_02963 [Carabus blaptoides fortunei]
MNTETDEQFPTRFAVKIVADLEQDFQKRFSDLDMHSKEIRLFQNTFDCKVVDVSNQLQMEIIDLQANDQIKDKYKEGNLVDFYKFFDKTVKRESETQWSARSQAVSVIVDGLEELVELLEKLAEDSTTTCDTRSEATILLQNILNFNFITLVHFWHKILRRIDVMQLRLQDPEMNFREAFHDLKSLATELAEIRDKICAKAIEKAKYLCEKMGY